MIFRTTLKHQIIGTAAKHLVKSAADLKINAESIKPFQPHLKNHRGAKIARENPSAGPDERFHAEFLEPSPKIRWRKPLQQCLPAGRNVIARGEIFERFRMRDVQATSASNEKFSPRRSLLLKNGRTDTAPGNHFGGPQPGRSPSN